MVKLSSSLPDPDDNGLSYVAADLVEQPSKQQVVVAVVETRKITHDVYTDGVEPTVQVVAIEPMVGAEAQAAARELLRRSAEARTGRRVLPLFDDGGEG